MTGAAACGTWTLAALDAIERGAAYDLHQCSVLPDAPLSRMTTAEYQRDRASRLCDLARRASDPEHRRYLLGRAAEAARQAETLEREAVAKPDKAASDPKATG